VIPALSKGRTERAGNFVFGKQTIKNWCISVLLSMPLDEITMSVADATRIVIWQHDWLHL
jgi:hypothetical protein